MKIVLLSIGVNQLTVCPDSGHWLLEAADAAADAADDEAVYTVLYLRLLCLGAFLVVHHHVFFLETSVRFASVTLKILSITGTSVTQEHCYITLAQQWCTSHSAKCRSETFHSHAAVDCNFYVYFKCNTKSECELYLQLQELMSSALAAYLVKWKLHTWQLGKLRAKHFMASFSSARSPSVD